MLLEQVLKLQVPRPAERYPILVVWSAALYRRGACQSLLDWNRTGVSLHGHDSLHGARGIALVNRGLVER